MVLTPDTTISIYSGVEIDNGEQLAFSSQANQTAYFQSKMVRQVVNCTLNKKTGMFSINVPGSIVSTCNYISFINPSFDNKIIYARIVDYDYVNNECTEISYAIDYWQTWMFDVAFDSSFIEREHTSEADWEKLQQKIYDPTVFEMKTGEDLPMSKTLEKSYYEISGQSGSDGLKLVLGSHSITGATDTLGVLIKMASIDFKALDDAYLSDNPPTPGAPINLQDLPSYPFTVYLNDIVSKSFGFFYIPLEMHQYFVSRYTGSTYWQHTSRKVLGSGWTSAGLIPFSESSFEPPLCYIYDAYGAHNSAVAASQSLMGTFFDLVVGYETEQQAVGNTIVDLTIIPNDVMTLAGSVDGNTPLSAEVAPTYQGDVDPKLFRFPYTYARVISPCGDVRELHYENFKGMQDGNANPSVYVSMDLTDKPTLIVAPKKYRSGGLSKASSLDTNIEDALYFSQFPTLPYNIDAYTAQCAAVTNMAIASRTEDAEFEMTKEDLVKNTKLGKWSQQVSTVLGGAGAVASSPSAAWGAVQLGSQGLQVGTALDTISLNQKQQQARERMWMDATGGLGNKVTSGEVAEQLKLTKAAYASDHYYPSNGIGATNFNYLSYCDIILMNVALNDDVVQLYTDYFKHYGYSSGRCGHARVWNYIRGIGNADMLPHWVTIDGRQTTYVKTVDCKLRYSILPVAAYIKNMFDSGVRMIKGDLS